MNLHLPLDTIWFQMTGPDGKPEDYRKPTPYWCSRLCLFDGEHLSQKDWGRYFDLPGLYDAVHITFKQFTHNIMTLGYPKKGDPDRKKVFEHLGIEIRTGNPEWGAEPGEIYFVIKHGKQVK